MIDAGPDPDDYCPHTGIVGECHCPDCHKAAVSAAREARAASDDWSDVPF
jgi:hypothetical protein